MAVDTTVLAQHIRQDVIRQIHRAGSGHPGGALSCADILAVLFGKVLRLEGEHPDRLVLSKGHACPALYATWGHTGIIPLEELEGLRKLGSRLQGLPHPCFMPLVETSTGSLGQGFSVALGMALGFRHQNIPARVVAILGDGEMQGGIVWETAMAAAHYKMGSLKAVIDYNKLQSDAPNAEIMGLEPLADKWRAFGWTVTEVDGHDHAALEKTLSVFNDTPQAVIAHTVKGKGVGFMENVPAWHGSVKLSDEDAQKALEDLGA